MLWCQRIFPIFLVFPLIAEAGGILELVPDNPGPYFGGEPVSVDVWLRSEDVVGHYIRLVQLDASLSAPTVYAGGWFTKAGIVEANSIAQWKGDDSRLNRWRALGIGLAVTPTYNAPVVGHALAFFDDGTGSNLYVGGSFITAGGVTVNQIARWDETNWSSLGGGMNYSVRALSVFDDGTGQALYAGGAFTIAGADPINHIAKWDGVAWTPLGSGTNNMVLVLTVFDDGTGPGLYAGGYFTTAGGASANYIARWDGNAWSMLDTGTNDSIFALTVFDDGTGPALYAGGEFTIAGNTVVNYIARWDGISWSPVGGGMNDKVFALTVWDDGAGKALYAGGKFTTAGNTSANRIAKWDGTAWSSLGSGVDDLVYTIDAAERPNVLFAGGKFSVAGGISANHIASWDGTSWSELETGTDDWVHAITVVDDIDGTSTMLSLAPTFAFDFSTLANGENNYFLAPNLPNIAIAYRKTQPFIGNILYLPSGGSLHIGVLDVVLPCKAGSYTLDVANSGSFGAGAGAQVQFGFGANIDEPFTAWATTTGELTGGTYTFDVIPLPLTPPTPPTSDGSCTMDAECDEIANGMCTNGSCCYNGRCDLRKMHRLSFVDNNNDAIVAYQVELTDLRSTYCESTGLGCLVDAQCFTGNKCVVDPFVAVGTKWWVGAPDINGLSRLTSTRVDRAWIEPVIAVTDCEIVNGATYQIRAIPACADEADPTNFSLDLMLNTTEFFGDLDNNGILDITDIVIMTNFLLPDPFLEIAPEVPDGNFDIGDIITEINAVVSGGLYPYHDPSQCGT